MGSSRSSSRKSKGSGAFEPEPELEPELEPDCTKRVSASDLERYGFCPMSWWLELHGEEAHTPQAKKGIVIHEKLAMSARKVLMLDQRSKRYELLLVMFSIVVIMLSIFGVLLYFSQLSKYFSVIIFYFNLFSVVWALLACAFFINVIYKDRIIKKIRNSLKEHLSLDSGLMSLLSEGPREAWMIIKWFLIVMVVEGVYSGVVNYYFRPVEKYFFVFGAVFFLSLSLLFYYYLIKKRTIPRNKVPNTFFYRNSEYKTISMAIIASGLGIFTVLTNYYQFSLGLKILIWTSILWAAVAIFFFFTAIKSVSFISHQYFNIYLKVFHKDITDLSSSEYLRLLIRRRNEYRKGSIWLVVMSIFLSTWGFIMQQAVGNLSIEQIVILGRLVIIVALVWLVGAFMILYFLIQNLRNARIERKSYGIIEDGEIEYVDSLGGQKEATLYCEELNISGKPDLVLEKDGYYIPQEIKTGNVPKGPYFSHILQLAAYLKLVEDHYDIRPPYGYIQYGEEEADRYKIYYDDSLEELLKKKISEMERSMKTGQVHRNHRRVGKCSHCSRQNACPEKLVKRDKKSLSQNLSHAKEEDVKVGNHIDITIESMGKKNDGIARVGHFTIFAPGTGVGDRVLVQITDINNNLVFTHVEKFIQKPSFQATEYEEANRVIGPGDLLEITIIDEGRLEDGIGRIGHYTIFVPGAEKGDVVKVKVHDVKDNLVFSEMKEVVQLGK